MLMYFGFQTNGRTSEDSESLESNAGVRKRKKEGEIDYIFKFDLNNCSDNFVLCSIKNLHQIIFKAHVQFIL